MIVILAIASHLQYINLTLFYIMIFDALLASLLVALTSIVGAFFFGSRSLGRYEKYVIPVSVGVFLSLAFYELIPETLLSGNEYAGLVVAAGFISFYILSSYLHKRYHDKKIENCDTRGAASMVLIGDAIHNLADGFILGAAFLVNPALGAATAVGLALHEIPQEIVEFGVLVRGGYTRIQALLRNLLSASTIVVGTLLVIFVSEHLEEYVWIFTGFAAGNLLYLAGSELLPRIHGNLSHYGGISKAAIAITTGLVFMTLVLDWTHNEFGHGHVEDTHHQAEEEHEVHDEHGEEDDDHIH